MRDGCWLGSQSWWRTSIRVRFAQPFRSPQVTRGVVRDSVRGAVRFAGRIPPLGPRQSAACRPNNCLTAYTRTRTLPYPVDIIASYRTALLYYCYCAALLLTQATHTWNLNLVVQARRLLCLGLSVKIFRSSTTLFNCSPDPDQGIDHPSTTLQGAHLTHLS